MTFNEVFYFFTHTFLCCGHPTSWHSLEQYTAFMQREHRLHFFTILSQLSHTVMCR